MYTHLDILCMRKDQAPWWCVGGTCMWIYMYISMNILWIWKDQGSWRCLPGRYTQLCTSGEMWKDQPHTHDTKYMYEVHAKCCEGERFKSLMHDSQTLVCWHMWNKLLCRYSGLLLCMCLDTVCACVRSLIISSIVQYLCVLISVYMLCMYTYYVCVVSSETTCLLLFLLVFIDVFKYQVCIRNLMIKCSVRCWHTQTHMKSAHTASSSPV